MAMPLLVKAHCETWLAELKSQLRDAQADEAMHRNQTEKAEAKSKELTKAINYMTNWLT